MAKFIESFSGSRPSRLWRSRPTAVAALPPALRLDLSVAGNPACNAGTSMTTLLFSRNDDGRYEIISTDQTMAAALAYLQSRIQRQGNIASPQDTRALCSLKLSAYEHEVFAVLFLDAQLRVIEFQEMFRGTLTQTSVYPREVLKETLRLNAAAVVLAHNHPSGAAEPSQADEMLTQSLKRALDVIDVKVLDHIIVAGDKTTSFAERGLL